MKLFNSQTNKEKKYRKLLVGLEQKIPLQGGKLGKSIYFDNAATTPPFTSVMDELNEFAPWYASTHRGKGFKSLLSDQVIEKSRELVTDFVHADKELDAIIFTKNTTESINLLANAFKKQRKKPVILSTEMEHISNDLPWREDFDLQYVKVKRDGTLSMDDLEAKLKKNHGSVKLITVTAASNVTGFVNPVHTIARLAHQHGALIHVDGAQAIPHLPFDMKPHQHPEHIDFLSFSGHKMYAPFGAGVLIGPKSTFDYTNPLLKGGGTVRLVSHKFIQWDEAPGKLEAGTPNLFGIAALGAAIRTVQKLNMKQLHEYEDKMFHYALNGLKQFSDIQIYGAANETIPHVSLLTFTMDNMHHNDIAQIFADEYGIAVRSGYFCAHPYVQRLLNISDEKMRAMREDPNMVSPGLVRISFSFYNTKKEIDTLITALQAISSNKDYYKKKYIDVPKGACGRPQVFQPNKKSHNFTEM
ncbi:MAG: Cysteine desulfurase [Bacillales bacterium]|jgi:selenocysteine lyase/cysteine desulfurase|nr:Cysteine desulfurase [Bacillales bacterium]